jgi:hypothetical protein
MDFIANLVGVDLRVERRLYLPRRAAKDERTPAGGQFFHLHAMPLQPVDDLRRIAFGDAEALAILLGREPLMVVSGVGIVLCLEQSIECVLLRSVGQQREHHVLHRKVGGDRSGVVLRQRKGMHVAAQRYSLVIVNVAGDAVSRLHE